MEKDYINLNEEKAKSIIDYTDMRFERLFNGPVTEKRINKKIEEIILYNNQRLN